VVAEGIETDVQAHELLRLGCTHAQGYLFSKPLATNKVEEILVANKPLMPKPVQPSPVAANGVSGPFQWPEHVPVRRAAVQPTAS
jgi:predicted signal transduction protein with EAL and GGDEF domain